MTKWNFADLWEMGAEIRGDQRAQVFGDQTTGWTEFNRRANGIAQAMLDAGVAKQDKSAQYLYNSPPYLESVFASFKAGLVPVNTNYRYADNELLYLWDNSDAAVVTFHGTFVETIDRIRARLPKVKLWLWVDDGSGPCPEWAADFDSAAAAGVDDNVSGPWGRSGDDRWFLYTGGTTGMPKGVMWDQDTLIQLTTRNHPVPLQADTDLDTWKAAIAQIGSAAPVILPGAPLMHGTGHISAIGQLLVGGCVVTLPNRHLDPVGMLDAVEREKVNVLVIVGDAFARPIADALDAEPDRWDLSSVASMVSSGVMWSQPIKARLLEHMPQMIIFDSLGSSEALGMGASYSTKDNISTTAKFEAGENSVVIREDGVLVEPGSGDIGRLGVVGFMPIGYYKDEVKTAATFPTIDGTRYSLPGDWATIEADGTITLLGRGSVCINTGGEKVFPEEVEEVLKMHPRVVDAIAVGVPDERFGQAITAVIEPTVGAEIDEAELIAHVKSQLAAYKAPRQILVVDSLTRAANGKIDYKKWSSFAAEEVAARR
jgi:acyl-CoA synthetase (AMP-forming)/AMP-acid ligase II